MSEKFCEDCDNVHPDGRNGHPRYWMCIKHKRSEGFGFVTRKAWDKFAPYLYCADVNNGYCPLWTPKNDESESTE